MFKLLKKLRHVFFFCLLVVGTPWAYGDMFLIKSTVPQEQRTVEIRLDRLNDYLCSNVDEEAKQRAEEYYQNVFFPLYDTSRLHLAAGYEYLELLNWLDTPHKYWLSRGMSLPGKSRQIRGFLDDSGEDELARLIGEDLAKKAVSKAELRVALRQAETKEKVYRDELMSVDDTENITSKNKVFALALACVFGGCSAVFLVVFLVALKKYARLRK